MKPYASTASAELYVGDCIKVLAKLPASSVDLVFADPPYNLSNGGITCHAGRMVSVNKGAWDKSRGLDQDFGFVKQWLTACKRVLKPSGTIWVTGTQHVIFLVGYAMQSLGFHLLNTITWYKPNASPNLSCRFFTHSNELVIWAAPLRAKTLKHTFNYEEMRSESGGKQMRDVWKLDDEGRPLPAIFEINTPGPSEKRFGKHPTQKPIELLRRLILASSNRGDVVLDPFNGGGTTGVAAILLGRRYVGVDTDHEYLDLTLKRLTEAEKPEQQLGFTNLTSQEANGKRGNTKMAVPQVSLLTVSQSSKR